MEVKSIYFMKFMDCSRASDRYHYQFLIRGPSNYPIYQAINTVKKKVKTANKIRVLTDIDPLSTFF